jgi:hypothetical protein
MVITRGFSLVDIHTTNFIGGIAEMRKFRKGLGAIVASCAIISMPLAAFADSSQSVNVNANVYPATPSSFGLNFNGITFNGDVGSNTTGTAYVDGQSVDYAKYTVSSTLNFDVYVSGSNLVSETGEELTSRRITVNQYSPPYSYYNNPYYSHEASLQVNNDMTKLYSGSNQNNQDHTLQFNLDLTTQNNQYADNGVLSNLKDNKQFSSQVTFTYTGL